MKKSLLLKNGKSFYLNENCPAVTDVLVVDGKIKQIAENISTDTATEVLDLQGYYVSPGLIDVHSHACLMSEPSTLPHNDNDYNEWSKPITPSLRALDAFDPFDYAVEKLTAAGFTSIYTGPGSANLIGGLGMAFKLKGKVADEMAIEGTEQMKFALGENPKRFYGLDKKSPVTRMGNAALIRQKLYETLEYDEAVVKAEKEGSERPKLDLELEALRPVVKGEKRARIHCHKANDICTAIRICEEFNLLYALEHVTEGWMIVDYLAEKNPYCVIGPLLMSPMKKELWNVNIQNAAILSNAGLRVALNADTASSTQWLTEHAGIMVKEGMTEEAALKGLTQYPAEILGVEDRLGLLAEGKDADLAVFDGHPFSNFTNCKMTIIDGEIVYNNFN